MSTLGCLNSLTFIQAAGSSAARWPCPRVGGGVRAGVRAAGAVLSGGWRRVEPRCVGLLLGVVEDKGPTELGATDASSLRQGSDLKKKKKRWRPSVLPRLSSLLLSAVLPSPPRLLRRARRGSSLEVIRLLAPLARAASC